MLDKGLYVLSLLILSSCSKGKVQDDVRSNLPRTASLPYHLHEIPKNWSPAENNWFDFYLPRNWKSRDGWGLDSKIGDIVSPDSSSVLYFDDFGFGRLTIKKSDFDSTYFLTRDSLKRQEIYFNTSKRSAILVSHESFWLRTRDSLTAGQYEIACKILQTVILKPQAFTNWYFKAYDSGRLYTEKPDVFGHRVSLRSRELSHWGFTLETKKELLTMSDFGRHWWLKIFQGSRIRNHKHLPQEEDWQNIKSIRQVSFKKTWKFFIEEWEFENAKAARSWLKIAVKSKRLDDSKPPRAFWLEEGRMYVVMASAAQDWFEHGNELTELMAGKKRGLLEIFNEPIDLIEYKKGNLSNSGAGAKRPYYHQPDTSGIYYRYFWFHHLRRRFSNREIESNSTILLTYIHGDSIGNYHHVSEELIAVKSGLPDSRLKHLNLVGLDKESVQKYYGFKKGYKDLLWEKHDGDLLIVHFRNDTVDWFNFVRTNFGDQTPILLPEELEYFDERIPNP